MNRYLPHIDWTKFTIGTQTDTKTEYDSKEEIEIRESIKKQQDHIKKIEDINLRMRAITLSINNDSPKKIRDKARKMKNDLLVQLIGLIENKK